MQDDFEESLDAHSQFVPFGQPMEHSLVATSEKIFFDNASTINRQELEKDKKHLMPSVRQQHEQQSANQFLDVGKWKKAKESTMHKDLAEVKQQVDQIITQTRWRKKQEAPVEKSEEDIADESMAPEEGEDQIEQDEEVGEEEGEQEGEEDEEQDDGTQEEDEEEDSDEEEEEQSQEEEQDEQEGEQQEEQEVSAQQSALEQQQELPIKTPTHSHQFKNSARSKQSCDRQKIQSSEVSEDDKTDTRSEMKKTQYLPSKWAKKGSQVQMEDPWARKEAILMRISKLVA